MNHTVVKPGNCRPPARCRAFVPRRRQEDGAPLCVIPQSSAIFRPFLIFYTKREDRKEPLKSQIRGWSGLPARRFSMALTDSALGATRIHLDAMIKFGDLAPFIAGLQCFPASG
jgi:hypothetical protein